MFLGECKYVVKEKKKIPKYIIDNIEIFDEEKILMKKILIKKLLMRKLLMKKILMKKILMKKKKIFFLYMKMLNKYYHKSKEKLQKEAPETYQNLSEGEKDKKRKYSRERYQHFAEEEKENRHQYYQKRKRKLPECKRNYYLEHMKYILSCFEYPRAIKFIFMD